MVGTSTVAKAMFSANGRLVMLSALVSMPFMVAAYACSCAVSGMPATPGIPVAKADWMPREMVAVSMTRDTVVMMELREMGMDRARI